MKKPHKKIIFSGTFIFPNVLTKESRCTFVKSRYMELTVKRPVVVNPHIKTCPHLPIIQYTLIVEPNAAMLTIYF